MSLYNLVSKQRSVYYRSSLGEDIRKALSAQKQLPVLPYAQRKFIKRSNSDHPLEQKLFRFLHSQQSSDHAENFDIITKEVFTEMKNVLAQGEVKGTQKSLLMNLINSSSYDHSTLPAIIKLLFNMNEKGIQTDIYFPRVIDMVLQTNKPEFVMNLLEKMRQHKIPISKNIYIRILSSWGSKESNFVGINKLINEMKQNEIPISTHTMNCALPAWLGSIVSVMKQSEKSINIIRSCYSFLQRNGVKPNHKTFEILIRYCPTMSQMEDIRSIMKDHNIEANLLIRIAIAETYFRLGEGLRVVHAIQVHPFQHSDVTQQRGNFERTPFSDPAALVPEISSFVAGSVVPELCNSVLRYIHKYGYGRFLAGTVWRTMEEMMFAPSKPACLALLGSYQLTINDMFETSPQYRNISSKEALMKFYPDRSTQSRLRVYWEEILTIYPSPSPALVYKYMRLLASHHMCEDLVEEFRKCEVEYRIRPGKLVFSLLLNATADYHSPVVKYIAILMKRYYNYSTDGITNLLKTQAAKSLAFHISQDIDHTTVGNSFEHCMDEILHELAKKKEKEQKHKKMRKQDSQRY